MQRKISAVKPKRRAGRPGAGAARVLLLLLFRASPSPAFTDGVGSAAEFAQTGKKAANLHGHRRNGRPRFPAPAADIFSIPEEEVAGTQASITHPRAHIPAARSAPRQSLPYLGEGEKEIPPVLAGKTLPQKRWGLGRFLLSGLTDGFRTPRGPVSLSQQPQPDTRYGPTCNWEAEKNISHRITKIWPCSAFKHIHGVRNLGGFNGERPQATVPAQTPAPAIPGCLSRLGSLPAINLVLKRGWGERLQRFAGLKKQRDCWNCLTQLHGRVMGTPQGA